MLPGCHQENKEAGRGSAGGRELPASQQQRKAGEVRVPEEYCDPTQPESRFVKQTCMYTSGGIYLVVCFVYVSQALRVQLYHKVEG